MSSERLEIAEAEAVDNVEGNRCGTAMRGAVALPESRTPSRRKGTRRNLGDLGPPAAAAAVPGRGGKPKRATPLRKVRGVGRLHRTGEASNNADHNTSAAESVEGRRPVEGKTNRSACSGRSTGTRMSLARWAYGPGLNGPPTLRAPVAFDLRQEPGAGKPHAGICAGGRQ